MIAILEISVGTAVVSIIRDQASVIKGVISIAQGVVSMIEAKALTIAEDLMEVDSMGVDSVGADSVGVDSEGFQEAKAEDHGTIEALEVGEAIIERKI